MKIKCNTKLMPFKNPNFEIKNKIDDLINLLKYIPIVIFENEEEDIIGFISSKSNFCYDEDFVYGDIVYFSEKFINYEFLNYLCYVKDGIIEKIDYIQFKKGE